MRNFVRLGQNAHSELGHVKLLLGKVRLHILNEGMCIFVRFCQSFHSELGHVKFGKVSSVS